MSGISAVQTGLDVFALGQAGLQGVATNHEGDSIRTGLTATQMLMQGVGMLAKGPLLPMAAQLASYKVATLQAGFTLCQQAYATPNHSVPAKEIFKAFTPLMLTAGSFAFNMSPVGVAAFTTAQVGYAFMSNDDMWKGGKLVMAKADAFIQKHPDKFEAFAKHLQRDPFGWQ